MLYHRITIFPLVIFLVWLRLALSHNPGLIMAVCLLGDNDISWLGGSKVTIPSSCGMIFFYPQSLSLKKKSVLQNKRNSKFGGFFWERETLVNRWTWYCHLNIAQVFFCINPNTFTEHCLLLPFKLIVWNRTNSYIYYTFLGPTTSKLTVVYRTCLQCNSILLPHPPLKM